ncbi:uncharacterized protein LOC142644790 [Dermatophagoides pteronyssinus]|uniref:Fasciculation and elongation protein n=1 Tax=Dermatophagoides pteronyssinus TaxID=6956 RepID=A0ABQ8JSU6_DERPT|nr:Fasciculation and elongation protein [Dermatophagoides pteronyssinus]
MEHHYHQISNDDDGDGDFGDFQTCVAFERQTKANDDEPVYMMGNVFELPWFEFQAFRQQFQQQLVDIFADKSCSSPFDFMTTIPSQEDIINNCPIWLHLTEKFRNKEALNFRQSYTFKLYLQSLKLGETTNRNSHNVSTDNDLPANARKRNTVGEEEDIANDLDMHSLIISSFGNVEQHSSSESNRSSQQQDSTALEIDADQVIKEIESLYASNQSTPSQRYSGSSRQLQLNKTDPLLSLDAATLLDVALKNWKSNRLSSDDYDVNLETFEYCNADQEYHSLPADLNSDILDQVTLANPVLTTTTTADKDHDSPSVYDQTSSIGEQQLELVDKLNQLTIVQLNELYMELEQIIQIRSEVLIQELALRDELEYEKEQKNQFISLLLSVQNKRRHHMTSSADRKATGHHHHHNHSKRMTTTQNGRIIRRNSNDSIRTTTTTGRYNSRNGLTNVRSSWLPAVADLSSLGTSIKQSILPSHSSKSNPVYLTTVIPYTSSMIPIDSATLDILIKLLKALNEDSPTVPALLTDYILKVICP